MDKKENIEPETELSSEERFKQTVENFRPYVKKLWAVRKKFIIVNGIVGILAVAFLLLFAKPYFDTTVKILPDYGINASTMLGQLSGLASLAGVSVGQAAPNQIYQTMIPTEAILAPVIYAKYKTEEYPDSVNLIEYEEIEANNSFPLDLQPRRMFLDELEILTEGRITTDVDRTTFTLSVTVRMPEGQLSADVTNGIAKSLDNYIQSQIRTSAKEQRIYIEKRMSEVKDSLSMAENKVKYFNEINKFISQSPSLLLELTRLQRNVQILNSVYVQLAQQAEITKLQEVKDTPVINVMEPAKNPVKKTGPRRLVRLIIIMFFSTIFSAGYFIFNEEIKIYLNIIKNK